MADVKILSTRVALNTSTGNQDITISGFGTVKAALFELTYATTDQTARDEAVVSSGATDGTRHWNIINRSSHGLSDTQCTRRYRTGRVIGTTTGGGSVEGDAAFSAFITDGVRINIGDAFPSAYLLTVTLFGGADLTVRVDTINMSNVTSAQTYSSMGFETDVLLVASANDETADAGNAIMQLSYGFVHNNGAGTITQRVQALTEANSVAAGAPFSRMMEDKGCAKLNSASGAIVYETSFSSFGSAGFNFTNSASANFDRMHFLSLKFGGAASAVGTYEPPVTATTSTLSLSFTPQFCLLGLNGCTAVDTAEGDSDAGPWGIAVMDATSQYSNAIAIEDAAATTNTQSMSDNQAINFPGHAGANFYKATLSSMDASGVNLSFNQADGTTRKWIYLAVEAAAGGGGGSVAGNLLLLGVGG